MNNPDPTDSAAMDAAVLAAIGEGRHTFTAIYLRLGPDYYRPVDRALQRLRKHGAIKLVVRCWSIVEVPRV